MAFWLYTPSSEEAKDVAGGELAPCAAHGRMCKVPAQKEDVCQSGFSCCQYSPQNAKRYVEDVVAHPDPKHAASWEATKSHLATRKPMFALLENSKGILRCPQRFPPLF